MTGSKTKTLHKPSLLSRLAALYFTLSYGLFMYIWILAVYLCSLSPILIPFLFLYTLYISIGPGVKPSQTASYPTPWKSWKLWYYLKNYFPRAQLHKTQTLDSNHSHIICYHPHGVLALGGWLAFGTSYLSFNKLFPSIDIRVLTLDINFRAPFLREYLLLHGVCSVSRTSIKNILNAGKSVMLAVGGGSESLLASQGRYDLILRRRQGFVKIALETGACLVPSIGFGEPDTFTTLNTLPHSSPMRRFQRHIEKMFGFTLPLALGSGVFFRVGILPHPVPLDIVVGAPLRIEKYEGVYGSAEYQALVDKYHALYIDSLMKLWHENKEKYAKNALNEFNIVE